MIELHSVTGFFLLWLAALGAESLALVALLAARDLWGRFHHD